jgi:hypothetical protein
MLVAVATLGIAAATATLLLVHINAPKGDGDPACVHEYTHLQAALDAYMANANLATIPASAGTFDMTAPVPLYHGNGTTFDPNYVRDPQTRWSYAWDQMGHITAIQRGPGGAVPAGCVVSGS